MSDLLTDALRGLLVAMGVLDEDADPEPEELLLAAEDATSHLRALESLSVLRNLDIGPAVYYLSTDRAVMRLDFEPPSLPDGGEWEINLTERERAMCLALLEHAHRRVSK